jgi:putative transposase
MNYRRYYIPDSTVFIVAVTRNRTPYFSNERNVILFEEVLEKTKARFPFDLAASVILPDHCHLLLRPIRCNFSQVVASFKKRFTDNFKGRNRISTNFSFWQGRFWDHVIRNDDDFKRHLDYIHYNPVRHGYVSRPEEWPHSSYMNWVRREVYTIGWGHTEERHLKEMNYE